MRFVFHGVPVSFRQGDNVLTALLRHGVHPGRGGCLCLAGDCPHCLAIVDGVAYTRTCQTPARAGLIVEQHPADGLPPLVSARVEASVPEPRYVYCDVVVIGMGEAGRSAAATASATGQRVVALDAESGQHAVGVYPGPLVVARAPEGILHIHPAREIVVATGASEIQPVAPGDRLTGIYTRRAAPLLAAAGVDLGRTAAVGEPPAGVDCECATGELLRFEGETRVTAVVTRDEAGREHRYECDSVVVGLGLQPRNTLLRMAGGLPVRAVGDAAREPDIPPCPRAGTVCPCSGVTVADLDSVWERGFHDLELVKRATLAGTGPCQGSVCTPHVRSFLLHRGKQLQSPFTARPVTYQLTLREAAAGAYHEHTARTALDSEHRKMGAIMERSGGWWRPWKYTSSGEDPLEEYWAVREAVSLCDVSTLGKMLVSGAGALELLERLYPVNVETLKPGRCRYSLLLDERGYVRDDGMICRDSQNRFFLTFTSAGSNSAEMWVRQWAEHWRLDVRLMNQTMSLGALNVTGPLAPELLVRAGVESPSAFLRHATTTVAGIPCRVCRLSFTGEVSFELHHPAGQSQVLWRRLMELGRPLGIKPHGLETMLRLRLEKGHIVVGQDTDFDSTPRRLAHNWAVHMDKEDFVGKDALLRTNKTPLDRQLAGLETPNAAPPEGAILWHKDQYAGYITSSAWAPVLGKSVMLGWLKLFDGELPTEVRIGAQLARRVPTPFYDAGGTRARV